MSNIIDLNKYKEDKIAENYKTKTTGDFYNKIIKASALKSLKNGMISQEVFDSKFKDLQYSIRNRSPSKFTPIQGYRNQQE